MEDLRLQLLKAKNELKNILEIKLCPPGMELEFSEIQDLEIKLKQYIQKGEKMLKENNKKDK